MAREVSSEKRLRESLEGMLELYDSERQFRATQSDIDSWIEFCEETKAKAKQALAASEHTDLERLVERLDELASVDMPFKVDHKSVLAGILMHIAEEFGVGEGE